MNTIVFYLSNKNFIKKEMIVIFNSNINKVKKLIYYSISLIYFLFSFCFCSDNLSLENKSNNPEFYTLLDQHDNVDFNNFCKEFRRIMPIDRYSYPEDSLFSVYQSASAPKDICNFMEFSKPILSSLTIYDRSYSLRKLIEIYNKTYNIYNSNDLNNFYVYILNKLPGNCRFDSLNLIFLLYVDHLRLDNDDRLIFISFIEGELSKLGEGQKIFYLRKDLVNMFSARGSVTALIVNNFVSFFEKMLGHSDFRW